MTSIGSYKRTLLTLREKLIKIGAKVVRHGRYITFQLGEVAIPRSLLAWGLAFASGGLAIFMSPLVLATMGRRAARDTGAT